MNFWLQSIMLSCLLFAVFCVSTPVPVSLTSQNSGFDSRSQLSHTARSIEAKSLNPRVRHDSEYESEISVEQKSLLKRQTFMEKKTALVYHYTCPISEQTQLAFEIRVKHVYSTGQVEILRSRVVQYITNQHQEGYNPIMYSGQLFHNKCVYYSALRLLCDYHFFGIIEGEVYPLNITTEFLQDIDDERLEPTVSEHCYHRGPRGEKVYISPAHDCVVHEVEVYTVHPPPETDHSNSTPTKRIA